MELTLDRKWRKPGYTVGNLLVDGVYFCDTLEDTDRGLTDRDDISAITARKVRGRTAIPAGRYRVTLSVQSPRFKDNPKYRFCAGRLPRLLDVPGFEGVLIHIGNYPEDTDGCILVGRNRARGAVLDSTGTFVSLYGKLKDAETRGERIMIEIK